MLSPEVIRFISEMISLKAVGCVRVQGDFAGFSSLMQKADQLVSEDARPDRARFIIWKDGEHMRVFEGPAIIAVEDSIYSAREDVRHDLGQVANYFLEVK